MNSLNLLKKTNLKLILLLILTLLSSQLLFSEIIISDVTFSGNQLISDKTLKQSIISRSGKIFNPASINEDIKTIEKIYTTNGYYNIKIPYPEILTSQNEQIAIIFNIEESEEIILDSVSIVGQSYISNDKMKNYISTDKIPLSQLPDLITEIVEYYNDSGFMFTEVKLDSIKLKGSSYTGFLSVSEGRYIDIKEFLFRGNNYSTDRSLLKISQLEKYKIIRPDILKQAEERINRKPYIKKCSVYLVDNEKILIDVAEDKMTYFSGILGYNNSQKGSDNISGYLDLEFLNLFGSDRALGVSWQKLISDKSLVEISYHESGPSAIPLNGDFSLSRQEVDSTYVRSRLTTEIYYYTIYNNYGISFEFDSIFPGNRRPKLIPRNDLNTIGLFWEYSNVHSINPLNGSNIKVGYYNIFYKTEIKNDSRQKTEFGIQTYVNPLPKSVIFLSFNGQALENKDLQDYELFTLGGINNLRGYDQDQFMGHQVFWANFEYRFLLSYSSRLFTFFDYGYIQKYNETLGKLFGIGIGLRLDTRLGLLGIDYGVGYENGKFRNPLDGIVHFGLETKL